MECVSSIDCLSCLNGVLYQYRCLASCPDSTYITINNNITNNNMSNTNNITNTNNNINNNTLNYICK